VLAGCASNPPVNPGLSAVTLVPTFDLRDVRTLCDDLNAAWAKDWPRSIDDLEKVRAQKGQCGNNELSTKLYAAYYNYGVSLESTNDLAGALKAFQNALMINPQGKEAARALRQHNVFTPVPLITCSDSQVQNARAAIPNYEPPQKGDFVRARDDRLVVGDQPYKVRGINYYPVHAPWQRFLSQADLAVVAKELDLIHSAGFNTLRIFLYYDALFQCPGSGAVPKADVFVRLDSIIKAASKRGFRLIVTLNDLPDLTIHPLYLYPDSAAAQTEYIVKRYQTEPAILAWDLRNEGDIDIIRNGFQSKIVLDWLVKTSDEVRHADPNHLITAGWNENAQTTESAVDIVSFHHWSGDQILRLRIATLKIYTKKPVLIEEIGFSTLGINEVQQGTMLRDTLKVAESNGAAGWLVWTAFDFPTDATCIPSDCPSVDNGEHHFGLWHTDYTPKPSVAVLKALMGS
jgi:hypothetical protein